MQDFIPNIAFTGAQLDLKEDIRTAETVQAYVNDPEARAIIMLEGRPALDGQGTLILMHPNEVKGQNVIHPAPLFLGVDDIGPVFAFQLTEAQTLLPPISFQEIRSAARTLDHKSLAMTGQAKSLFDWHRAHAYCANCGELSKPHMAGLSRTCPSCQTEHFPRVNPVAIMLVLDGDKCLLGRGESWPEGAYSALAGFISPGESLEEGVKREVLEESGIEVTNIRYLFSQPWPFPSQLMLGMICDAVNPQALKINKREIEDAIWVSKSDIKDVFDGRGTAILPLPYFTIAHELLRAWVYD